MMFPTDTTTERLEISDSIHHNSWQASQSIAVAGNRLQAYINQVGLQTVCQWLQEMLGEAIATDSISTAQFALVNGSVITLSAPSGDRPPMRLVLVPSETMDRSEFRVPQEWIDIPTWAGDYYMAVEVDPDDQWVEVWAYTTHATLKTQGVYDPGDRTYHIDASETIPDLSVLWVMRQLASEPTRAAIAPLPSLSTAQAKTLIAQLSDASLVLPRLECSFAEWGALLGNASWLQQLCQGRSTLSPIAVNEPQERAAPLTQLNRWLDSIFESGWRSLDELLGGSPELAFSFRREDNAEQLIRRVKPIQPGLGYPTVFLLLMLEPDPENRMGIRVRLLPATGNPYLPAQVRLTLRSEEGEVIQSVQTRDRDNSIQLKRFRCAPNMRFQVEVGLHPVDQTDAEITVVETFEL